jgi:hypothetical protein
MGDARASAARSGVLSDLSDLSYLSDLSDLYDLWMTD